jgi:hypothetical protein
MTTTTRYAALLGQTITRWDDAIFRIAIIGEPTCGGLSLPATAINTDGEIWPVLLDAGLAALGDAMVFCTDTVAATSA